MKDEMLKEEYFCYECGTEMKKADDEVLVCPECGHSVDIKDYLTEEEDYNYITYTSKYDDETYFADNEEFPSVSYDDEEDDE